MNIREILSNPAIQNVDSNRSANEPVENQSSENKSYQETSSSKFTPTTDSKLAVDKATGLFQVIVSEKNTDEIIRKIPEDEYLRLLSLLDNMISGSINDEV